MGFVVAIPTFANAAVAVLKSISASGIADPNPIGPDILTCPNVDTPEVVKIFASSVDQVLIFQRMYHQLINYHQ